MAVLEAQIISSQGLPVDSSSNIQSNIYASIGNYLNSLLVNNAHRQTVIGEPTQTLLRLNPNIQYRQSDYINYQSRLARFFGINARQTSTHLIIQKSDLPLLTSKLSNSAESLLIALLLHVMLYESNSLISTVYAFTFNKYLDLASNLIIIDIVINLYLPIIDTLTPTDSLAPLVPNSFN